MFIQKYSASVYGGCPLARVGSCSSPLTDTIIANYWAATAYICFNRRQSFNKNDVTCILRPIRKAGSTFPVYKNSIKNKRPHTTIMHDVNTLAAV